MKDIPGADQLDKTVDPAVARKLKIEGEFIAQNTIDSTTGLDRNTVMARPLIKGKPTGKAVPHELLYFGKVVVLCDKAKKSVQLPWGSWLRKKSKSMSLKVNGQVIKGKITYLEKAKQSPDDQKIEDSGDILAGAK